MAASRFCRRAWLAISASATSTKLSVCSRPSQWPSTAWVMMALPFSIS